MESLNLNVFAQNWLAYLWLEELANWVEKRICRNCSWLSCGNESLFCRAKILFNVFQYCGCDYFNINIIFIYTFHYFTMQLLMREEILENSLEKTFNMIRCSTKEIYYSKSIRIWYVNVAVIRGDRLS